MPGYGSLVPRVFPTSFNVTPSTIKCFLRRRALRLCIHLIRERLSLENVKCTRRPQKVFKSGISSRNLNLTSYAWGASIMRRKQLTCSGFFFCSVKTLLQATVNKPLRFTLSKFIHFRISCKQISRLDRRLPKR